MPSGKTILSFGTHWVDRLLRGVQGYLQRMAYDLLAPGDYLTQAATNLLMHGNLSASARS